MPVISAKFGPRRDVTEYPAWQVLQTVAIATDKARLSDLVSKELQKVKR